MREKRRLEETARKILRFLKDDKAKVAVFWAKDNEMKHLNRTFLGKSSSTNVLSFNAPDFPRVTHENFLGEIYLNPTYIKRHKEDINFMLIHGLLHLLGYNHKRKGDRIKMQKLEDKIFTWLKAQS